MRATRYLGSDVFAALLPLLMGGVALFLAQGEGWWQSVVALAADGTLMPPAVLICFAVYRRISHFKPGKARSAADGAVIVFTVIALLLFAFSIQPDPRAHSEVAFAWFNGLTYAVVILLSVIVGDAPRKEVDA